MPELRWRRARAEPSQQGKGSRRPLVQKQPRHLHRIQLNLELPAQLGAGDCPGGRAGQRRGGKGSIPPQTWGLSGALLLSHRPAAGSPVRHQEPQSCPCLPDQHPPDPNSSREAVIGRLLLNTCNRGIVRAFVQLHLFATFRAQIKTQMLLPLTVCAPSPSVLPCPSTHSCLLVAVRGKVR